MVLQRDITMIWSDSAERAIFDPLVAEAKKRGYRVKLTDNPFEKCEIGIYCQHVNFPENSRFSLIMLHDIIQQYGNWPDIWLREPWDKYDVGILPGEQWVENWQKASSAYYTRPRKGVYEIGWPKADAIVSLNNSENRKHFYEKYGLDASKRTILYAPAWENDEKEDDFVQAMMPLGVNILIKQWDADPKKFPSQVENVRQMKERHEGLPGVTILPPETNIFVAIAASDLLVSEESSTMCEAAMMGIPALSVSDWLIPDTVPPRYPKCDYDFVWTTTKENLSNTVKEMLAHYEAYCAKTEEYGNKTFKNIGQSSTMIMDIIDDCAEGKAIRYNAIVPQKLKKIPLKQYFRHLYESWGRIFVEKYARKYTICRWFWRGIKHILK